MSEIEHPTINQMKVIVECEKEGIEVEEFMFHPSEIEELCGYMLDEYDCHGLLSDSQQHLTNEFGEPTGVITDVYIQAVNIVEAIESLRTYKDAKKLLEICKKYGVNDLEFVER